MKKKHITSEGTFDLPFGDYDRIALFIDNTSGTLGGTVLELLCYGSVIHVLDLSTPVQVSMGKTAPLSIRVSSAAVGLDIYVVAHEVA